MPLQHFQYNGDTDDVDATTMEEYFAGSNLKKKFKGSCETKLVASMSSSLKDQNLTDPPNLPDKCNM